MMLSCRDLDILRLLRWCRMIRPKELCEAFSEDEVMNLSAAQMIRFSDAAKAWCLTPCGNRVLGSSGVTLPPAKAPTYREPDITRRLRLAQIVTTAYAAGVNIFLTKESELQSQPSSFLPFLHRNRGSNPWGSIRVAALLHTGGLMCAIHWVNPGIGYVALTDELTAFQNHTAAIPAKQRGLGDVYRMIATESIEEINRRLAALSPEHPAKYPHGLFLKAKENLWGNIVIGLGNRLAVFQSRLADKITRNHDVDLLLPGKRPCVYFVIISAQDSAYRFLSSLFFSLALPQLSNFARLQCPGGRLPVLTNFCLDEYCNIGYLDGVADSLNSIRGFNMSAQIVVQSLSQWQEKYPGKEWENQLATFDQTLYMGCNDLTSAKYISEKCGKVTISVLNNQMPMMPLFSPVYSSTRPYSQTRSNTQRDLMNPDEVLRLENRKCLALFKGHKPALLYKMTPEELPDYAGLTTCRVIDYIPEWRRKETEAAPQKRPQAPAQKEASSIPKPPEKEKQSDRSGQPPAYDLAGDDEIGMVECTVESIRGL